MDQPTDAIIGEKLTFIDLFRVNNYSIEVPIIQRDYAQGRSSKLKIRNTFLEALYNHIDEYESIDLDFVYGTVSGKIGTLSKFIPLDGQQRLTTLFLLHWYLAHKDNQFDIFREQLLVKNASRFTYETRTSSREFCDALILHDFNLTKLLPSDENEDNSLAKTIKNAHWYFMSWDDDPTIKGMLTMLSAIHIKFNNANGFFDRLTNAEHPLVTFQFLNLENLKMTDDLYIKMNARGKPLTDYENFKAQFIKFIEDQHSKYYDEFSEKIDGKWCDLFWDHAVENDKIERSMDDCILAYFDFISEMLFYKTIKEENKTYEFDNFKLIEEIFTPEENLAFLMSSLDLFSNSSPGLFRSYISDFFTSVFTSEFVESKVALFDKEVNLFQKLIYQEVSFEHKDKLIFFSLLYYCQTGKIIKLGVSENLKNYLRICRNFIIKINQKGNASKKDEFVSDLRTAFYEDVMKTCSSIYSDDVYRILPTKEDLFKFRRENMMAECRKAVIINQDQNKRTYIHKLEDHSYLKGDLRNFESMVSEYHDLSDLAESFYTIFGKLPDDLIIRSLLAIGDYTVWVGNSYFGGLWFFGKGEKWHRILTDSDDDGKLKTVLKKYFAWMHNEGPGTIREKLEKLIAEELASDIQDDWRRLFLKYKSMTKTSHNIYSFHNSAEYEVVRLGGTSLRSAHINSFVDAVIKSEDLLVKLKSDGWAIDTNESQIPLKYAMYMVPREDHWFIDAKAQNIEELAKEFKLKKTDNDQHYELYPTAKKDFVAIAVDFINYIYQ